MNFLATQGLKKVCATRKENELFAPRKWHHHNLQHECIKYIISRPAFSDRFHFTWCRRGDRPTSLDAIAPARFGKQIPQISVRSQVSLFSQHTVICHSSDWRTCHPHSPYLLCAHSGQLLYATMGCPLHGLLYPPAAAHHTGDDTSMLCTRIVYLATPHTLFLPRHTKHLVCHERSRTTILEHGRCSIYDHKSDNCPLDWKEGLANTTLKSILDDRVTGWDCQTTVFRWFTLPLQFCLNSYHIPPWIIWFVN